MSALRSRSLALRGAAVLAAFFATLAVLGTWRAAPAEATSYRFWSYWLGGNSDWSFSSQGASRRPADGTVDGWRFAISEASSSTIPPRHSSSFGRICGSTDAVQGSKRVGLVVDFGTTSDAPDGETPRALISTCVVAPVDANGYEVLDLAAVQMRTNSGLVCGLNGYPATECGVAVPDPAPSPTDNPSGTDDGGGPRPGPTSSGGGSTGGGQRNTNAPSASAASGGNAGKGDDPLSDSKKRSASQQKDDGSGAKGRQDGTDPSPEQTAVAAGQAAAAVSTGGSGSPVGMGVGVGVVAALLATAYLLRRRRA
ncbi:MAG: hypothetical protein LH645_06825 [Actinomycetia bacterium]|nr:hypothetical protein [Actinomycetes bacterium]